MNTEEAFLFEELVYGGASWSHVLKRGTTLRLTDIEGAANVGALFYNFQLPTERYNMPDTLKAQHTAKLTTGHVLYSDMGRILCSIVGDSIGWHDPLGGCSNPAMVDAKYGQANYQDHRNDYHKNAQDNFLIELGKWGLGPRDMVPNVNFFSKVAVSEDGTMSFVSNHSPQGSYVNLRAEMNVLVVLNTSQHPLDPATEYHPKPVLATVSRSAPPGSDDVCRLSCPENGRGFIITERFFL